MFKLAAISAVFMAGLPSLAALPVAPFTTPSGIQLPYGLPSASLPPGTYRLNNAFRAGKPGSTSDFREDYYVGESRRRGDIVSVFLLVRSIRRPNSNLNAKTPGYGEGLFMPSYGGWLNRYDCQNDRMQMEKVLTTSYARPADKGFIDDNNMPRPGQVKTVIEGREYWAMKSRYKDSGEWSYVRPGSYGAKEIDYVCSTFK